MKLNEIVQLLGGERVEILVELFYNGKLFTFFCLLIFQAANLFVFIIKTLCKWNSTIYGEKRMKYKYELKNECF